MVFVNWLKYFFGNFFSHRLAEEGRERRFGNSLLSLLFAALIIYTALVGGYFASFSSFYSGAESYKEFLYGVFANENADRLNIKISGGAATSSKGEEEFKKQFTVNTFENSADAERYSVNGYQLLIDTRDAKTNYNDFDCYYIKGEEKKSREEYFALSEEERKGYSCKTEYTAKSLTVDAAKAEECRAWLLSDDCASAAAKSQCEALSEGGAVPESNYNAVYELWVKYYYLDIAGESFGNAPTMRTYYFTQYLSADNSGKMKYDKFMIVLSDVLITYFYGSHGVLCGISGYVDGLSGHSMTRSVDATAAKKEVDSFILAANDASSGVIAANYFMNLFSMLLIVVLAWLILSLAMNLTASATKCATMRGFASCMRITGGFFLISSLFAFAFIFIASFFLAGSLVYNYGLLVFIAALLIRTVIYIIMEVVSFRKNPPPEEQPTDDGAEGEMKTVYGR
ncbi:MAG: hypothetical protein NC311_07785 [Muribaculaceae bacterium]|nr:hypothetical protein [Muribaculaceae bacterium]